MNDTTGNHTVLVAEVAPEQASAPSASLDAAHRLSEGDRGVFGLKVEALRAVVGTVAGKALGLLRKITELPAWGAGRLRRLDDMAQRNPRGTVRVILIVTLGLALAAGLLARQASRYDTTATAREQATVAARDSVTQVLSYNFRTIDRQLSDVEDLLTGTFKDDYAALLRDSIAPMAKQTEVAVQTEVAQQSVVSSGPDQVVLLLYVNQQTTDKNNRDAPRLTGSALRVTVLKQGQEWRISELTPL